MLSIFFGHMSNTAQIARSLLGNKRAREFGMDSDGLLTRGWMNRGARREGRELPQEKGQRRYTRAVYVSYDGQEPLLAVAATGQHRLRINFAAHAYPFLADVVREDPPA